MTGARDARALRPAPRSNFRLPRTTRGTLTAPERELALAHARSLLEPATAPYHEDAQLDVVRRFVAERPGFSIEEDEHANLIVTWKGARKPRAPVLAFSAHLDHPGFHYEGSRGGKHRAVFHGGVPVRFFVGAAVRFFDARTRAECATATIAALEHAGRDNPRATLCEFRGSARKGMFGMWDLTPGALRGTRLHARVCDDLMGAASILGMLDVLARAKHPRTVLGIFTRAEETGFVGCQGLLRSASLGALRGEIAVIGLECSPRRATAKVGKGPVIRVGDKQSVFDPALTHHLQEAAASLRARHPGFQFQRALMDGGSCESTAYNLWNVRAGALCLALGNYHNCGPGDAIAPEFVDWNDYEDLIALMVEAAITFGETDAQSNMRARLERIWERERARLEVSARRMRDVTLSANA